MYRKQEPQANKTNVFIVHKWLVLRNVLFVERIDWVAQIELNRLQNLFHSDMRWTVSGGNNISLSCLTDSFAFAPVARTPSIIITIGMSKKWTPNNVANGVRKMTDCFMPLTDRINGNHQRRSPFFISDDFSIFSSSISLLNDKYWWKRPVKQCNN